MGGGRGELPHLDRRPAPAALPAITEARRPAAGGPSRAPGGGPSGACGFSAGAPAAGASAAGSPSPSPRPMPPPPLPRALRFTSDFIPRQAAGNDPLPSQPPFQPPFQPRTRGPVGRPSPTNTSRIRKASRIRPGDKCVTRGTRSPGADATLAWAAPAGARAAGGALRGRRGGRSTGLAAAAPPPGSPEAVPFRSRFGIRAR